MSARKKNKNWKTCCRSFVDFKKCRSFFSCFCRNKNEIQSIWPRR
jgi:hypothetical protein